jgi:hypothetical protein
MKTDGTFRLEAVSSEQVKGTMKMVSSGGGRAMNIDIDFNGRYLGPACGDTK